jgi:hypothetical protein
MVERDKRILPIKREPTAVLQHLMKDHGLPHPSVDDVTSHGPDLRATHSMLHNQEHRYTIPHKHQIFPPLKGFSS